VPIDHANAGPAPPSTEESLSTESHGRKAIHGRLNSLIVAAVLSLDGRIVTLMLVCAMSPGSGSAVARGVVLLVPR
jgi:hypothetical protein